VSFKPDIVFVRVFSEGVEEENVAARGLVVNGEEKGELFDVPFGFGVCVREGAEEEDGVVF